MAHLRPFPHPANALSATSQPGTDATPSPAPVVRIRGLRTRLGSTTVFDGIDLDIPAGSVVAIMGPSGTGKTTLLRHITGQLRPDAGSVHTFGEDVSSLPAARLYALRRRMGMLFQHGALLTDFSVFDNVAFPLRENTDLPERLIRPLVLMKLQAVGLRGAAGMSPAELSGGMARRVALARALALDPPLMIYDEPLTGLDPIASGVVMSLVRRLNDTLGLTSIVVTHHVHETLPVADHAIVIANGGIVFSGTPVELEHSSDPLVRQFLRGEPDGPIGFDAAPRTSEAA
jgi:phospholipid/cholesterol/gamma-HCH transport system ATP-binding protein